MSTLLPRIAGLLAVLLATVLVTLAVRPEAAASVARPVSPFEVGHPAIAHLDPSLRTAVQRAAEAAAAEGIELVVNSGWRSNDEQARLFDEAVATHGSAQEAARWVAPAQTSTHVSGMAVDVGGLEATIWLGDRGSDFGLCRTYANENWHFEYRAEAIGGECPPPLPDASHDPRLRAGGAGG